MKESVADQGTHYFTAINALAERHRYCGGFDEPSVVRFSPSGGCEAQISRMSVLIEINDFTVRDAPWAPFVPSLPNRRIGQTTFIKRIIVDILRHVFGYVLIAAVSSQKQYGEALREFFLAIFYRRDARNMSRPPSLQCKNLSYSIVRFGRYETIRRSMPPMQSARRRLSEISPGFARDRDIYAECEKIEGILV